MRLLISVIQLVILTASILLTIDDVMKLKKGLTLNRKERIDTKVNLGIRLGLLTIIAFYIL